MSRRRRRRQKMLERMARYTEELRLMRLRGLMPLVDATRKQQIEAEAELRADWCSEMLDAVTDKTIGAAT